MTSTFKRTLPLSLLVLAGNIQLSADQGYTQQQINDVTNYYIGSFGGKAALEKEEEKKEELPLFERMANFFKYKDVPAFTRPLSAAQEMNLMISENPLRVYSNASAVVDKKLLYDERVFNGGDRPEDHLFARLAAFVSTLAGKRHMVEILSQPISDMAQLNARQEVVKELVSNPALLDQLSATLDTIKENELAFLNIYIDKTTTEKESIEQLLFGKWLGVGETLNTNATALEVKRRLINILQFSGITYPFLISAIAGYKFERIVKNGSVLSGLKRAALTSPFPLTFLDPRKAPYAHKLTLVKGNLDVMLDAIFNQDRSEILKRADTLSLEEFKSLGFEGKNDFTASVEFSLEKTAFRASTALLPKTIGDCRAGIDAIENVKDQDAKLLARFLRGSLVTGIPVLYGFTALGMWGAYRNAKFENDIILCLQQQLIQLSRYVRGCEKLYIIAKNNPALNNNLELIGHLKDLVARSKNHSADFNQLINLLNSSTFSGNASFFSLAGKVLAAQNIITKVRSEFKGMVQALGEIDAAVAIAKLYNHFSTTKTPYCFPTYISSDTPYLKAEHFWNPFLNPEYAVTNSLEFGSNGHPRTMILTGPNTGGKSTCIEGILINALCAQTIGIAPAAALALTPFDKITLYARITDDIGAGDSRFQAEVKASKKQLETARNVHHRAFSLNIRDEGIVGTDREVGEGAEERFTKLLAETPNSINLCSTHYKKMIKLEATYPEMFKNYHMQIGRSDAGKLIRHFTIGEGASTINIAMDILQEQGIV